MGGAVLPAAGRMRPHPPELWLVDAEADHDIALNPMSSTDERDWRELTVIRDVAGICTAGDPLTLAFQEPVLARSMTLQSPRPGGGRIGPDAVRVRSRVLAQA